MIILLLAIICMAFIAKGKLFAQTHARVRSCAGACIISSSDTLLFKSVTPPTRIQLVGEVKIGLSANEVMDILGYPIDKVKVLCGNKGKWIYEDINIYFENDRVKIIQKKSLEAIS